MFTASNTTLLHCDKIDRHAWDNCIDNAPNGLPYANSWYLDIVCTTQWYGIVLDDYKAVFPLPYNRKLFGFHQIYQPILSQQLGLFGTYSETDLQKVISQATQLFRRVNINLNANNFNKLPNQVTTNYQTRTNYTLALATDYPTIAGNYSKSLRKRLRKAAAQLVLATDLAQSQSDEYSAPETEALAATLIATYRQQIGDRLGWTDSKYSIVKSLIIAALKRNQGFICQVNDQSGQLMAIGFFLHSKNRIINLFGASTSEGKNNFAMHFLLDSIIKANAASDTTFDFEGSDISGVAEFFRSFGAVNSPYGSFEHDNLPWLIKTVQRLKSTLEK